MTALLTRSALAAQNAELLAALKQTRSALETVLGYAGADAREGWQWALDDAGAAIARAEGRKA